MRVFSKTTLLIVIAAAMLSGLAGCNPGGVVWKANGDGHPTPLMQ